MTRKSLNDVLSSDRSVARGAQHRDAIGTGSMSDIFDDKEDKFQVTGRSTSIQTSSWPASDALGSSGNKNTPRKGGGGGGNDGWQPEQKCYHTHPPLKMPGTELVIFGGSCNYPAVTDADVYIGFDSGMAHGGERSWPWKKGHEFLFRIQDMGIPTKPEEFRKLVMWTRKQLEEGKKVHCGCIGGHGRTGTFLAALVSTYGESDAINYVRDNYCKRAVESKQQINMLHDEYGIKKVSGSKEGNHTPPPYQTFSSGGSVKQKTKGPKTFPPMAGRSIWDAY